MSAALKKRKGKERKGKERKEKKRKERRKEGKRERKEELNLKDSEKQIEKKIKRA